jgi:hypothetical protein
MSSRLSLVEARSDVPWVSRNTSFGGVVFAVVDFASFPLLGERKIIPIAVAVAIFAIVIC